MSEKKKSNQTRRTFSAMEKAQAVLAIWSERRKPSEICREYSVKWAHLNHWQTKALEGMLKALEPKNSKDKEKKPALTERLKKLLDRKIAQNAENQTKLRQRLVKIQEKKEDTSKQKE